ncbi:hypothetical protein DZF89_11840 [Vibrio parahaemolyticus]|nr:hypothetical protein [Vibrio parahaemolyticus]
MLAFLGLLKVKAQQACSQMRRKGVRERRCCIICCGTSTGNVVKRINTPALIFSPLFLSYLVLNPAIIDNSLGCYCVFTQNHLSPLTPIYSLKIPLVASYSWL